MVHQVDLGENTNCPAAKRIDMTGKFQGLRVNDVDVRRRHSQDNAVWLCDVFGDQIARLLLDIGRLVSDRYLWAEEVRGSSQSKTRQATNLG